MDKRLLEIIKYGATFGMLILFFFGGGIVLKGFLGVDYPMMVVVSDSMVPTLGVGDYIFVASVPDPYNINAAPQPNGEIVVFLKPNSSDEYIVHRIIDKVTRNGEVAYITKGDHNMGADAWFLSPKNIVGRVINRVPLLGYFSLFIKTFQGFALVVILMGMSFFIDNLMPKKKTPSMGRFNPLTLIPLLIGPVILG
ncbi:signal peptidase I, partial [Candidatus Bathyarchaeota archaeon]|nr:signal peptidase I [Candidatus Bathyarchaeota archaeon]